MNTTSIKQEAKRICGTGLYTVMNDANLIQAFNQMIACTQESGFKIAYDLTPEERANMTNDEYAMWEQDAYRRSSRNRQTLSNALMALEEMKIRGLIAPKEVYRRIDYLNRVGT